MGLNRIYLLDTNIVSEPTKINPQSRVLSTLDEKCMFSQICAPVWFELLTGVYVLAEGKKRSFLEDFTINYVQSNFPILPYDSHCAHVQADIYARMQKNGTQISMLDMQIAATAIANNLIVVTRNKKHFEPIQREFSLMVENWFEE
mgnify:CR=1 FL=1